LGDQAIIQKVREAPTKLKRSSKAFLVKLRKVGVKLDEHGELDLTDVATQNEKTYILKNSSIVKLTLM